MPDNDMEHLQLEWSAHYSEHECTWYISTGADGTDDSWHICGIYRYLPGDFTGEKSARYICDLHNSRLAHAVPTNHDYMQSEGRVK